MAGLTGLDSALGRIHSFISHPSPTSSQTSHSSRYELPSNHYPWAALNVVHS